MRFKNSFKDKILRFIHKSIYKPGHYYSAVPDPKEINKRAEHIFNSAPDLKGVNLNIQKQIDLLKNNVDNINSFPFIGSGSNLETHRYKLPNNFFGYGDALALFIIFREFRPRKVIEIGSGYSSAAMLDFNDLYFESTIDFHFIEPYPDRLNSLLSEKDKSSLRISKLFVQDLPLSEFDKLNANDILFVDSSHVSKIGSDVNHIIFNILPRLKKGVLIHFHDIFFPFEYPKDWIDYGIYWNESYLLRAFLSHNSDFEIILFNNFLATQHNNFDSSLKIDQLNGGSLWIRKLTN